MKKLLLAAAIASIASTSAFATTGVTGGTVDITGLYLETSCDIVVNDGGSSNGTIALDTLYSHQLKGKNDKLVGGKEFTIKVVDCNAKPETVTVSWVLDNAYGSSTGQNNSGYFENNIPEGAKDLNLTIQNSKGESVRLLSTDQSGEAIENGVVFKYNAGYIASQPMLATAGRIEARAVYNIAYD